MYRRNTLLYLPIGNFPDTTERKCYFKNIFKGRLSKEATADLKDTGSPIDIQAALKKRKG